MGVWLGWKVSGFVSDRISNEDRGGGLNFRRLDNASLTHSLLFNNIERK